MTPLFKPLPSSFFEMVSTAEMADPFSHTPEKVAEEAAFELQKFLTNHDIGHDFGLTSTVGLGKMMGVLVSIDQNQNIGYLSAFSGKLDSGTIIPGFVPPVFDTFEPGGIYKLEEEKINELNRQIIKLENEPEYLNILEEINQNLAKNEEEKLIMSRLHKTSKAERKNRRKVLLENPSEENETALIKLDHESARQHFEWKDLLKKHRLQAESLQNQLSDFLLKIEKLKEERRLRSGRLQQILFDQYTFLNALGETKNLKDIFAINEPISIPSGAGECTAPKLLQYAYQHQIKPLALAEFWWGVSPASEVRKHGQFYPACRAKCFPILGHMLKGLNVKSNIQDSFPKADIDLPVLYEDAWVMIINKPPQFLSVPGKLIQDSVQNRWRKKYPEASGPLIVHRLDMSTSGILLGAKTKETHAILQKQFEDHTIKKRYVAILDGVVSSEQGQIDLPLRVDLDDRPRQLVCYDYGKPSTTYWKHIETVRGKSRVHFFPVTGRTHQLRVHAAHHLGLGLPILGDDLYGNPADRLYLHAEYLEFIHPHSGKEMKIHCPAPF